MTLPLSSSLIALAGVWARISRGLPEFASGIELEETQGIVVERAKQ